jgi:ribulose-5-phosphate 4-epimerase/fuculose-1-phosphate aldolase
MTNAVPVTPSVADRSLGAALVAGCRVLDGERLTDAFGHLSARLGPEHLLITPRVGPGLVESPDELLEAKLDGEVVRGDQTLLPGETPIHLRIMRAREDVSAVCRFHGPSLMAFSTLGEPLPPTIGIALAFGPEVPIFATALTITTSAAGDELADTLGAGSAVLMQGFGAVTVGRSVGEAVVRATLLERGAAAVLAARAAGTPLTYSGAQAEKFLSRTAVIDEQLARAWNYLQRRWPSNTRSMT